jgi:hypothetical protein
MRKKVSKTIKEDQDLKLQQKNGSSGVPLNSTFNEERTFVRNI